MIEKAKFPCDYLLIINLKIDYLQPLAIHKLITWTECNAHLRKFPKIFAQLPILLENLRKSSVIFSNLQMMFRTSEGFG